eukprot:6030065-Pleurochrysis_carterae.AAC.2
MAQRAATAPPLPSTALFDSKLPPRTRSAPATIITAPPPLSKLRPPRSDTFSRVRSPPATRKWRDVPPASSTAASLSSLPLPALLSLPA